MKKSDILNLFKSYTRKLTQTSYGETYIEIDKNDLHEAVAELTAMAGGTLLTITCNDERKIPGSGCFKIYYAFRVMADGEKGGRRKEILAVVISVSEKEPEFPSITGICVAANWYEREIYDMFGLYPSHHLDMKRLCHHKAFPVKTFPLRKEFDRATAVKPVGVTAGAAKVCGVGTYELPVGPIHAGIIEPGHFRFSCFGEHIINLDAQLFYTHRGLEKMVEGMDHFRANLVAERICGVCSFSHSAAYSSAVEKLADVKIPARASAIRVMFMELERIIGHLTDIMGIAVDVAFYAPSTFASKMREELMCAVYEACGSRYFHSVNMPGGLRRDISDACLKKLVEAANKADRDIYKLEEMLFTSTSFLERVETTGRLFNETAIELGIVGVGARGSGVSCDARKAFAGEIYADMNFDEITEETLDVCARMKVRLREMRESVKIINQAAGRLQPGPVSVKISRIEGFRPAFGVTESPKGEHVHFLMFDGASSILRMHVRSASFANWIALTFAVKGNIVPDFPVINKSFNLCYSSCDR